MIQAAILSDKWWLSTRARSRCGPITPIRQSAVRMESAHLALQIADQVQASYRDYGYELIVVPALSVAERVAFIESFVDAD